MPLQVLSPSVRLRFQIFLQCGPPVQGGQYAYSLFFTLRKYRNVAEQDHGRVGGDMVEVKTVVPYPRDYNAVVEQAQREQQNDARPQIALEIRILKNIIPYSLVFPTGGALSPCRFSPCLKNMMSAAELSSPSAHMKAAVSDAANRISSVFVPARGCLKALKSAVQEPAEHKGTWTPGCAKLAF